MATTLEDLEARHLSLEELVSRLWRLVGSGGTALDHGGHPLVLANQEGFVIRTGANAFPAGMTWSFSVTVSWAEVPAF